MKKLKLKKSHKVLLLSAVTAFSLFGGTVVTPLSTALATCSGFGCDGLEPTAAGCTNQVYTVATKYIYDSPDPVNGLAIVDLRYSPPCKTAWSRMTITDPIVYSTSSATVTRKYYSEFFGSQTKTLYNKTGVYQFWTNQLYIPYSDTDPYSIRASGYVIVSGVQYGPVYTGWWSGKDF